MFAANATDAFQTSFAAVDMASSAVSYANPSNGRNFFPSTLTVTPNGTLMISQYTSLDVCPSLYLLGRCWAVVDSRHCHLKDP